jgi:hypothetical protein
MLVVTLVSVVLLEQGTVLGREQHLVVPSPPAVRPVPAAGKSQPDAATQRLCGELTPQVARILFGLIRSNSSLLPLDSANVVGTIKLVVGSKTKQKEIGRVWATLRHRPRRHRQLGSQA